MEKLQISPITVQLIAFEQCRTLFGPTDFLFWSGSNARIAPIDPLSSQERTNNKGVGAYVSWTYVTVVCIMSTKPENREW